MKNNLPQDVLALGTARSVIRELFEFGKIRAAEVDGVRARVKRGGECLGRACGGQELGQLFHTERLLPNRSPGSICSYFCVTCCSSGVISISGACS